jgi:type IV secretory pathway VirD2 relaxase
VQRNGITREGAPGELYGADSDRADGKAFAERAEGDRHQFRFIVAADDSTELADLKPFARDLTRQTRKPISAQNSTGSRRIA